MKDSTLLDRLSPLDACRNQRSGILKTSTGSGRKPTPPSSHPVHGQDMLLYGVNKYLRKSFRGHRETSDHTASVLESDTEDWRVLQP